MTKPLVTFADPEHAIIDYLTGKTAATAGSFFPKSSTDTPPSLPFLQVAWDGTPTVRYPVTQDPTVRLTWWDENPTPAKAGLALAQAHMLAHPGDANVWNVLPLTGGLPSRDPDTGLWLCTATFRVSVRPTVVA